MVEEETDIEETEATWKDDTQTKTNVKLLVSTFRETMQLSLH